MTNEELQTALHAAFTEWGEAAKGITVIELLEGVVCPIKAERLEKASQNYERLQHALYVRLEAKKFGYPYSVIDLNRKHCSLKPYFVIDIAGEHVNMKPYFMIDMADAYA